jgi:hypothetical protein
MKKTNKPATQPHNDNGLLARAGEALHVLGEEIVHGKDIVVEAATEKLTVVKKAIRKIMHKKSATAKKKPVPKKTVVKKKTVKAAKKIAKKIAKKSAHTPRKTVKKAAKKIPAKKKTAPKK